MISMLVRYEQDALDPIVEALELDPSIELHDINGELSIPLLDTLITTLRTRGDEGAVALRVLERVREDRAWEVREGSGQ
jgi:hypothetical protein